MRKIIIILIIALTTFMGGNIYTNIDKQNEYIENSVEIVDTIPENFIIIPKENEENTTIGNEVQEIIENIVIEEQISVEKNEKIVATPKQDKVIEKPKIQEVQKEQVQEQNQVSQPNEETEVVETKPEPIDTEIEETQKSKEDTPKIEKQEWCTNEHNHKVPVGNSGRWFNTESEAIALYNSIIKEWGYKWEHFEIDNETYYKNCPYGYEDWNCPFCGKWTINFYYD